jgi:hypothetical protein
MKSMQCGVAPRGSTADPPSPRPAVI